MSGPLDVIETTLAKAELRGHFWDRLGIGLSVLCMVHCLAVPVLLTGLTAASVGESFHLWMALLIVPVAVLAAVPSYRTHRRRSVLWFLAAGVVLLFAALALEPVVGEVGENVVTVIGGGLLTFGHWKNWHARPDHRH